MGINFKITRPGILLASLFLSFLAYADDQPPDAAAPNHAQEWFKCQGDDECARIEGNCFDSLSVNKIYLDEFRKALADKVAPVACPKHDFKQPTIPKCLQNTCVMTDPNGEKVYLYQMQPLDRRVEPVFHRVGPDGDQ